MTAEQVNKEITFGMILWCMDSDENNMEPLPKDWETVEVIQDGFDLFRSRSFELLILRHTPTNTYWKTSCIFYAGQGYLNTTKEWTQVIPTETTQTVITYEELDC